MKLKYAEAADLKEIILSKVSGLDYLIIDVRDELEIIENGSIVNSININSNIFISQIDEIKEKLSDVPVLFFHCALSQVRGPNCARKYSEVMKSDQEVLILRDGFDGWKGSYGLDKLLTKRINFGY